MDAFANRSPADPCNLAVLSLAELYAVLVEMLAFLNFGAKARISFWVDQLHVLYGLCRPRLVFGQFDEIRKVGAE